MKDLIVSGPLIKIVFPPPSLLKANEISVKGQFYLSICSESTDKSPGRCDKVSPALDHVNYLETSTFNISNSSSQN